MEIWKDIKDYEGLYQVSNLGQVKSLERTVKQLNRGGICKTTYKSKLLKYSYRVGYPYVVLSKDNKQKKFNVHRLVAETFIPNPKNLPLVNHLDNNRANPCVSNLEWSNNSMNQKYRFKREDDGHLRGDKAYNSKLSNKQVISIRQEYKNTKTSYRKLANKYNVSYSTISDIIKNKSYKNI